MATKLAGALSREITIESGALRGDWVVTATPFGVQVRQKGRRTPMGPVSWAALVSMAAKLEAAARPARRRSSPTRLRVGT